MTAIFLYCTIVPSSAPINVTVVSSSARALNITWQPLPISDRNGIITSYKITYYSSRWMHGNTTQVNGSSTSAVLDSLIPFTSYNITISAATIIGFGPSSGEVIASTLQAGK